MMRCQNCGKAVSDGARFCPYCGGNLEEMQSEHEIFSNSTEKRLDDEIRQVENENAGFERSGNSFSPEYYSDGFDSDKNDDATKIFDNSGLKAAAEYAPYAPEDIDEYGNERANKHRKAYIVIVVCASVLILAIIVLAAILLGKNCGGTSTPAMSSSMISEPTAPTTATEKKIKVPDVIGEPEQVAVSAIEQRGLKASVIKQESDTVESGCVIDQNPKDGEMVELGSTVVISVAAESSGSSSGSAESTHSGDSESETEPAPTEATEEEQTEAQTEAQTEKPNSGDISTYILPESSDRYLDYPDLEGVDGFDLVLARNEIYARHGRLFDSQEVQDYFNRCTWYNGTISPEDFDESVLNSYERANVDFILQKEYSTME